MFKVLTKGCEPTKGSKYSACIDLFASEDVVIGAGETKLVGLGVCIDLENFFKSENGFEMFMNNHWKQQGFIRGHYLQLMLRSSLSKHLIIANGVGVIDLDYKDEIKIRLHNPMTTENSDVIPFIGRDGHFVMGTYELVIIDEYQIKKGQKIAQITLLEHKAYLFGVDTEEERTGGFGSTGDK